MGSTTACEAIVEHGEQIPAADSLVGVSVLAKASVDTPLQKNPLPEIQAADFLYGNEQSEPSQHP